MALKGFESETPVLRYKIAYKSHLIFDNRCFVKALVRLSFTRQNEPMILPKFWYFDISDCHPSNLIWDFWGKHFFIWKGSERKSNICSKLTHNTSLSEYHHNQSVVCSTGSGMVGGDGIKGYTFWHQREKSNFLMIFCRIFLEKFRSKLDIQTLHLYKWVKTTWIFYSLNFLLRLAINIQQFLDKLTLERE
jgi:hypothetical protein